uniref:GLOBIN domain-containing protein n=1 Tax=Elaeophora elaphi TaxID=1147741 RepID=A0A0R3RI39_9BILA
MLCKGIWLLDPFRYWESYWHKKVIKQKRDSSLPDGVERDLELSDCRIPSYLRRSSSMPSVSDPIIRPVLKHYDYDSRLNRLQKRFLRFTWHRLQTRNGGKRIANVFEEVYERLLRQLPGSWEMFTTRTFLSAMSRSDTATPRDHAKETVKLIDYAIKNLEVSDSERNDTGSDYDPFLLGKTHGKLRPYGFTGNYWEKLGEIIVDVVLVQDAVRDLPGAGQAWVIFIACLVDQLRAGFDDSKSGLTPTTSVFHQRLICDTSGSESTIVQHQHPFTSIDTTCYPEVNQCYNSQSIPPEYTSKVSSKGSASPNFDSGKPQRCGRRNYSTPVAKHNSSKFRIGRKHSIRSTTAKAQSKGQHRRCYSPQNLSSVCEVSNFL